MMRLVPPYRLPLLEIIGRTGSPAFRDVEAVLLRTDIVGFTILTDQMLSSGLIGTEQLAGMVRTSVEGATRIVGERDGDLAAVLGDGAVYLWPTTEEHRAENILRAVDAGLELQRQASVPDARIAIRCSVAAGLLHHFEVGGRDAEWHAVLSGPVLSSAIAAGLEAQSDSVAVSRASWDEIANRAHASQGRSGVMLVNRLLQPAPGRRRQPRPDFDVPAAVLRSSVAPTVLVHLTEDSGDWTGEFRTISVGFVVMRHLEHARPEDAFDKVQQAAELVQEIVRGLDGHVHQIRSDEEGVTAIFAFGLPPAAHEDDAVRAVQAALGIHGRWSRLGATTSTGIATGRVFATVLGETGVFALVGPTMNLAARLMQLNSGVVCDRETLQAGRQQGRIAARELAPLSLKGKGQPVVAFAPYMVSGEPRTVRTRLLGRTEEVAALAAAVRRLIEGEGTLAAIEGEPGIGKSALVAEVKHAAAASGVAVASGGGDETEKAAPYRAWRPVLAALLDLAGRSDQDALARVAELLGPESGLAPLLCDALAIRLSDSPETHLLTGEARAATTRRLIVGLIRQAAESSPQVVIIEDLHWLDSSSRALLVEIVAARPRVLFVVTTRLGPDTFEEIVRLLGAADLRLRLAGLSSGATGELMAAALGAGDFLHDAAEVVLQRTGGNPLFINEIVPVMHAAGLLTIANGKAALDRPRSSVLTALDRSLVGQGAPATLESIILARFDRLPARAKRTLQVLSVVGYTVDTGLLEALVEVPREDDLACLVSEGFLDRLDDGALSFRHAVVRNVVYGSMSFANRGALHLRCALAIADDSSRAASDAVLGHHFMEGGEDRRALRHNLAAAKAALRSYANVEAAFHAEVALQSIDRLGAAMRHGPQRKEWLAWKAEADLALGNAYHRLSRHAEARRHTVSGLAGLRIAVPRVGIGAAAGLAWQLVRQGLHRRIGVRAPRAAHRREKLIEATKALERLVEVYFFEGNELAAAHAAVRMLNFAERTQEPAALALGYANFAGMASVIPAHGMARRYRERALKSLAAVEDVHANTWGRVVIAGSMLSVGDFDEAGVLLEEAAAAAERATDRRLWRGATELLGAIEASRGQWDLARARIMTLLASADHDRDRRGRISALRELALFSLQLRAFDDAARWAEALADEVRRGGVEVEEVATLVDLHTIRATVALEGGDAVAALTAAGEALEYLRRHKLSFPFYYWTMFLLARVFLASWSAADGAAGKNAGRSGAREVRRAIARQARAQWIARPALHLVDAAVATLEGRPAATVRYRQRAAGIAGSLRLPYEARLAEPRGTSVAAPKAGLALPPFR